MKMVEVKQATAPLRDYARDAQKEPVIVTEHGRPIAALMPVTNADSETVGLSTNPQFLQLIERSRRRQDTEGGNLQRRDATAARNPSPPSCASALKVAAARHADFEPVGRVFESPRARWSFPKARA